MLHASPSGPRSARSRLALLALLPLLAPGLGAQSPPASFGSGAARPLFAAATPEILASYDLVAGELQRLDLEALGAEGWRWRVWMAGELRTVELRPHEMRGAGYQLLIDDGSTLQPGTPGACTTYRGAFFPGGHGVAASFDGTTLQAWARIGNEVWAAQSLRPEERARTGFDLLVHRAEEVVPRGSCGVQAGGSGAGGSGVDGGGVSSEAEIAIDADLEFYNQNNRNTQTTEASVLAVMNAVDWIYFRDTDIVYSVVTILVRTTATYAWNDDLGTLLSDFRSRWNSQHRNIRRDLAHLFTGKGVYGGVIGVAYLGVICSSNSAYGTSKVHSASFAAKVELVSHEIGHNWNAGHCSGSSCRIMCAGLGGCSGITNQFSSTSINSIVAHRNSRTCLTQVQNSPPTLSAIVPARVQSWGGEIVEIQGQDLRGATAVSFGGVPLAPGEYTILSGERIQLRMARGFVPGPLSVVVTNGIGPSNALNLIVDPTNPPQLEATGLVATSGQPFEYSWGGRPGVLYALALTVADPATITLFGETILARGYPILNGFLGPNGIGGLSTVVDNVPVGRIDHQLWTMDPVGPTWAGASPIRTTVFW